MNPMEKSGKSGGPAVVQAVPVQGRKARQSNMELLRLVSMLFVLMLHANYLSLKMPRPADLAASPLPTFFGAFIEQLAIVAVNVFVLISGWFGIRPRWKGLASLLFQVEFFSLGVLLVFLSAGTPVSGTVLRDTLYPVANYWFVVAYVGLFILSPVLNLFAERATRRQLGLFLVAFFTWEFFYGFIRDIGRFGGGYSTMSFVGLYLLARYVRLHSPRWTRMGGGKLLALYLLTVLVGVACFLFMLAQGRVKGYFFSYNSPFVILGSLCLVLLFSRFRLQSRFINWMAASSLSIYLLHIHPLVYPHFKALFVALHARFSGLAFLLLALLCLLAIGFACILSDQVRIFCWKRVSPLLERGVARLRR